MTEKLPHGWSNDDKSGYYRNGNCAVGAGVSGKFDIYRNDCYVAGGFATFEAAIAALNVDDALLSEFIAFVKSDDIDHADLEAAPGRVFEAKAELSVAAASQREHKSA